MDPTACKYDSTATVLDNSCVYPIPLYDCFGNCLDDIDSDGICDALEITGCTDANADNYDLNATDDDGSCVYCSSFTLSIYSQSDASAFGAQMVLSVSHLEEPHHTVLLGLRIQLVYQQDIHCNCN